MVILSFCSTYKWKCCDGKPRDNSVYLFFGTLYMALTMPMMCYLLVSAGTAVTNLPDSLPASLPAYMTAAVIAVYSIIEMLISRSFERILRFATVNRETSAILLFCPGLMFRLSVNLFFLTLRPFSAAWIVAALFKMLNGVLLLGGVMESLRVWLALRLDPKKMPWPLCEPRQVLRGRATDDRA